MSDHSFLLEDIHAGWGWTGVAPNRIVTLNRFGNVIFEDCDGKYWRICPEELSLSLLGADSFEFEAVKSEPSFQSDWELPALAATAKAKLGPLKEGRAYCLKLPVVLGGKYDESNVGEIGLSELMRVSGDLARQLKDLPDGSEIQIRVVD